MNEGPELFSRGLMARSLAYLFTAGALVGCLTLVFPHPEGVQEEPLYALAALAVAIGLGLLWRADAASAAELHVTLATGSLILAGATYFVGTSAIYPIIFTWTGLYAFYFFRPPVALAHLGLIGAAYAIVLALQEPPTPVVRWLLAIGTPAVAGLLISTLLDRVRGDAARATNQEQAMRASEARTRAIVDSAPDAFVGFDQDGRVISWNPAAERMFGWTAEQALGRPVTELIVPPEGVDDHVRNIRLEFEREDGRRSEARDIELRRSDGTRLPAEVTVSRVRAGDRPMLACFIRDMTERGEREREREQLYREQAAREEAEQMAGIVHGLQVLLDVALAHSRLDDMLEALLPRVCEVVDADGATVLLVEEDGSLTLQASMFGEVGDEPLRIEPGEGMAGRVVRDREPLLVKDPEPSEVADPALRGLKSILTVPLLAGREVTGVLQVGVPAPRTFSEDDLMVLGLAADRVALAIDHLRIYEREHRIAEILQRSLLPDRLPRLPGLEVAARYLAAASESEVGGDWYDVIAMPGGKVGLVMGDVAGKGLAAASTVGALRSAMRAYALEGHAPATAVERLNQLSWSETGEAQMTTLLYVVVDPLDGRVEWVSAGHLPPLMISGDGLARLLEGPGSVPLGVMSHPRFDAGVATLPPDGSLLLYTDGLVERPGEILDAGLDRLASAVRGRRLDPEGLCDHVVAELVPEGGASDDVALLVLRSPAMTDRLQVDLPSEPTSLGSLRSLMRRWLRHGGASDVEVDEILVAVGEAAANAIEHGTGAGATPFAVDGRFEDGEVRVEVRDRGGWLTRRSDDGGRGLVLMHALMDAVEFDKEPSETAVRMRRRLAAEPLPDRRVGA